MKPLMILLATLLLSCTVFAKTVDLLSRAVEVKAKNGAHAKYIPLSAESRPVHGQVTHVRGHHALDSGGDNCFDATVIPTLPYCDAGTTVGYSDDFVDCFDGQFGAPDVCYLYTPQSNEAATISLCNSGFDTELTVYLLSPDCDNLTYVDCSSDVCGVDGWRSCLTNLQLTAQQTYLIVVDGFGGQEGAYTLHVTTDGVCHNETCSSHGGDNCSSAVTITSLPYCDHGTTIGYFDDFTDCSGWGISPDVCYVYTPSANEAATISLCGSGFDTELALFMLDPDCDNLAYIDCNDDACGTDGLQSCITDQLAVGQTYLIIVDGYGGDAGDYILHLTTDGICGSDSCAPDSNGTGENCSDPIVISALPAVLTGNTSSFADDYFGCNNEGAGAPDVVFSYTPTQNVLVDIQTCNQTYFRSSVYIFRDGNSATPYACPGAHCGSFWNNTFYDNAQLFCVSFEAGHTYCIVLDGVQPADTGDFVMTIDPTSVQTCDPNQYCGFPRETEPNNSACPPQLDAHYLHCGDTIYGTICGPGDKDYYYTVVGEDTNQIAWLAGGPNCNSGGTDIGLSIVLLPSHFGFCYEFQPCNNCGWFTATAGPDTEAVLVEGMGDCKAGTYMLAITCDPQTPEPCDPSACTTAQTIACSSPITANTCNGCDIIKDFYRNGTSGVTRGTGKQVFYKLVVPAAGNYTIDVSTDSTAAWNQNVQFMVFTDCVLPKTTCLLSQDQNDYFQQVTGPRNVEHGTIFLIPGTYFIGASISNDYPYGTSCGELTVQVTCNSVCPPATHLVALYNAGSVVLTYAAPVAGSYLIYSTTLPNNNGTPPGAGWTLEATQTVFAGQNSWTDPGSAETYKNYVIVHTCP